jgi:hypothetical protein
MILSWPCCGRPCDDCSEGPRVARCADPVGKRFSSAARRARTFEQHKPACAAHLSRQWSPCCPRGLILAGLAAGRGMSDPAAMISTWVRYVAGPLFGRLG